MLRLSRSLPLVLHHDYRQIPFSTADGCQSCRPLFDRAQVIGTDPVFPLLEAYFRLNQGAGTTIAETVSLAQTIYQGFSEDTYSTAFQKAIKRGIFTCIVPPIICWTAEQPPTRYILNPNLDQNHTHSEYTKFLLSLVGGYQSKLFSKWFAYTPPTTAFQPCPSNRFVF